nr:GTPase [Salinadaptatus halalkaliphilus]
MSDTDRDRVALVGKESVGKSALAAGLTGTMPTDENVGGSTVSSERYRTGGLNIVDTPGNSIRSSVRLSSRQSAGPRRFQDRSRPSSAASTDCSRWGRFCSSGRYRRCSSSRSLWARTRPAAS